jgi:hypothetical protein
MYGVRYDSTMDESQTQKAKEKKTQGGGVKK